MQLFSPRIQLSARRAPGAVVLLLICLGWTAEPYAQYEREISPFPVTDSAGILLNPFLGGINSPKPALVDFDGDGLLDLFFADGRGKVTHYKNVGTSQIPEWSIMTERFGGLDAGSWFLLRDIDADGDIDLFCDGRNSFTAYYENNASGDIPEFTFVTDSFAGFQTGFNNTPALEDIDADGDYDFFFGNQSGGLDFYRNIGDATAPEFMLESTFYDSVLAFPGSGPGLGRGEDVKHGFSALSFADVDNDNDLDLFYGDIFNTSSYFFENLGDSADSDLTWLSETFLPFGTNAFNHAAFGDLDGDGDNDMIVGAANAEDIDNLIYLRNEYTEGAQILELFIVEEYNFITQLDVGSNASPEFADLDADGDLDLLIGGLSGRISHYENTGSPNAPVFEFRTSKFENILVGQAAVPILVDWDNDTDLDLLVGMGWDRIVGGGGIAYYENVRDTLEMSLVDRGFLADDQGLIKVNSWAVPQVADLNGDHKLDLMLGEWHFSSFANLRIYKNIGTPSVPLLTLEVDRALESKYNQYTLPNLYDWNGDGQLDLLLSGDRFGSTVYRNISGPNAFPDVVTLLKTPALPPGFEDGERLSYAFVDIDGDGDDDLFVGEEDGGLNFYRHTDVAFTRGDLDGSPGITAADIIYLINFLLLNGPAPQPLYLAADVDCSGSLDIVDAIHLLMYQYSGGPAPCSR